MQEFIDSHGEQAFRYSKWERVLKTIGLHVAGVTPLFIAIGLVYIARVLGIDLSWLLNGPNVFAFFLLVLGMMTIQIRCSMRAHKIWTHNEIQEEFLMRSGRTLQRKN